MKSSTSFSNASEKCQFARDYYSTGNEWNFHKGVQRGGLNSTNPFKYFEFGRENTSVALKKEMEKKIWQRALKVMVQDEEACVR